MLLPQDQIFRIHQAAVDLHLGAQRAALFAGLASLPSSLPTTGEPGAQLLMDLDYLNNRPRAYEAEVTPLEIWLQNAWVLRSSDPRAHIFQSALQQLQNARAPKTHPAAHEPSHTSLVLDRIEQWGTLREQCNTNNQHLVFIVHAEPQQHLHLFVRRIERYFQDKKDGCPRQHKLVHIDRSEGYLNAVTAPEWQRALLKASVAGPADRGLAFVLDKEVRQARSPVLFLLSDKNGPLHGFDKAASTGLGTFFRDSINNALAALRPNDALLHPLRFIIPIEHTHPQSRDQTEALATTLKRAPSLQTHFIPELKSPPWQEVKDHIIAAYGEDEDLLFECRNIFKAHSSSVLELGQALHDYLMDWEEQHF